MRTCFCLLASLVRRVLRVHSLILWGIPLLIAAGVMMTYGRDWVTFAFVALPPLLILPFEIHRRLPNEQCNLGSLKDWTPIKDDPVASPIGGPMIDGGGGSYMTP